MHGQRLHACAAAMQTGVEPIAISVPQSARACIRQAAGCQQPACIGLCPKTQNPTHRRFKGVMCLTDIDECEAAPYQNEGTAPTPTRSTKTESPSSVPLGQYPYLEEPLCGLEWSQLRYPH